MQQSFYTALSAVYAESEMAAVNLFLCSRAGSGNIPLIWQFLLLELSIDGLRLAAMNTPTMLSTPLSVIAVSLWENFQ